MANYTSILNAGLQAAYDAMESHDSNLLYFCTDTGKIYKGDIDFTNSIIAAATKPEKPIAGKVYILADTNTVEAYVGGAWKVLSYPTATTIDQNSDDVHVASAKAVYDAIQSAIEDVTGGATVVKNVEKGSTVGTIKVTKGDNTSAEVALDGVAAKPTWDPAARKLTVPVVGEEAAVEINFGKDIFLDATADNKYNPETKTIDLYLNDGSGEDKPATKISIPAADLIDVYTGENTNGAKVTVSEDNKIKVDIVIDPVDGNALVLSETGLKVDLSAYAKTEDVNKQVSAVQDVVDELAETVTGHTTTLNVLTGDATQEGSVAKQIADAKTTLQGNVDEVVKDVDTLKTDNTQNKADIKTNSDNIEALATAATTWGTF